MTTAITLALVAGATAVQAVANGNPMVHKDVVASRGTVGVADDARLGDKPQAVPVKDRMTTLGKNYRTSNDTAWTTSGTAPDPTS
ncbi:hypothetical protein ACWY4P_09940 [Streptomyces sp. LZ34]